MWVKGDRQKVVWALGIKNLLTVFNRGKMTDILSQFPFRIPKWELVVLLDD
jgi:hypothetical protein